MAPDQNYTLEIFQGKGIRDKSLNIHRLYKETSETKHHGQKAWTEIAVYVYYEHKSQSTGSMDRNLRIRRL